MYPSPEQPHESEQLSLDDMRGLYTLLASAYREQNLNRLMGHRPRIPYTILHEAIGSAVGEVPLLQQASVTLVVPLAEGYEHAYRVTSNPTAQFKEEPYMAHHLLPRHDNATTWPHEPSAERLSHWTEVPLTIKDALGIRRLLSPGPSGDML